MINSKCNIIDHLPVVFNNFPAEPESSWGIIWVIWGWSMGWVLQVLWLLTSALDAPYATTSRYLSRTIGSIYNTSFDSGTTTMTSITQCHEITFPHGHCLRRRENFWIWFLWLFELCYTSYSFFIFCFSPIMYRRWMKFLW